MDAAFFDAVRGSLFGGKLTAGQVSGIEAIEAAWAKWGDKDPRKLAYLLATAKHETAHTMQPIYERGQKSYFDKYEPTTKIGKALGNTKPGDGYLFRGRGFVQLTGRANYRKAGDRLAMDLVKNPDDALKAEVSAVILVKGCLDGWFTGKRLADYSSFYDMRRVVNGTDKGTLIAGYAEKFLLAIGGAKPVTPPTSSPTSAKPQRKTLMDWLKGLLVKQAVNHVAHQLKDTPVMNSNFLHNILNIAIALVAILSLPEVVAILPAEYGVVIAGVLAALKTVINIARDGFGGLFKEQPPVR